MYYVMYTYILTMPSENYSNLLLYAVYYNYVCSYINKCFHYNSTKYVEKMYTYNYSLISYNSLNSYSQGGIFMIKAFFNA